MQPSTIFTGILVSLAILGIGVYTQDHILDSKISEEDLDNVQTNADQATTRKDTLTEQREVKGRNNTEGNNSNSLNGIVLSSKPESGEKLRIVLYENGSRLTEEAVTVNGKNVGKTSKTGALTFKVPNNEELEIHAGEFNITESLEQHNEENNIKANFVSPEDERIEDYKIDVRAVVEASKNEEYRIEKNGRELKREQIKAGESKAFDETVYFENSGKQQIEILDSSNQTIAEKSIETTVDTPDIEIGLNEPEDSVEIEDYWVSFNYNVNSSTPYLFELLIDDNVVQSAELESGQQLTAYRTYFNEPGTYDWEVRAKSLKTGQKASKSRTFETSKRAPVAEIETDYPMADVQAGEEFTAGEEYNYRFTVEAFENLNWKVYLVGNEEELEFEGELEEGAAQTIETDPVVWETGEYQWYVEAESQETGETLDSDVQSFKVVQE